MVRGDIIGGLKIALSRGESLQNAMQSLYNAGYKKEDIEEAARVLNTEGFRPPIAAEKSQIPITTQKQIHPEYQPPPQLQTSVIEAKPTEIKQSPNPQIKSIIPIIPATIKEETKPLPITYAPKQIVSNYYPKEEKSGIDFITILLIVVLVVLLGILAAVFFFKQDLVDFLNNLFG